MFPENIRSHNALSGVSLFSTVYVCTLYFGRDISICNFREIEKYEVVYRPGKDEDVMSCQIFLSTYLCMLCVYCI